jgi:hypothetical protein
MSTAFFRFEVFSTSAGHLLPLGKRHEGTPATHIDLSLLRWVPDSAKSMSVLKLEKYRGRTVTNIK